MCRLDNAPYWVQKGPITAPYLVQKGPITVNCFPVPTRLAPSSSMIGLIIQGDQLYMAQFFWNPFPVYTCRVAYTGQVTFFEVLEKHGHV